MTGETTCGTAISLGWRNDRQHGRDKLGVAYMNGVYLEVAFLQVDHI